MHYCLCKKKGQGVRMYRSKSVEILAKNKTITYCECESKKLVIRNVWQTQLKIKISSCKLYNIAIL